MEYMHKSFVTILYLLPNKNVDIYKYWSLEKEKKLAVYIF